MFQLPVAVEQTAPKRRLKTTIVIYLAQETPICRAWQDNHLCFHGVSWDSLTGDGGSVSKTAHSQGRQIDSGSWCLSM